MRISELQRVFSTIKKQHGDIEVIFADREFHIDPGHELFVRTDDVSVEHNTPLTIHDFRDEHVVVLRGYDN
jgi:hypothetical protein